MPELLLILGSDEQLRAFQHGLHHHGVRFGQLHHAVEFQRQMLLALDVEHHAAHIGLVYRSHHLRHHRETRAAREGKHLLLILRDELFHHGNACRAQQCLHVVRFDVALPRDGVDDAADARHVHAEEFYLVVCRTRCVHDARKRRAQRHLVGKVHMPLLQEVCHLGTRRIDGRKDGEYRLAAGLHLLVQHVVHLEHRHQSRRAENRHHGIHFIELLLTILQAEAQMFRRARGEDVDGVAHRRAGKQLAFQLLGKRALQLGHVQPALAQGIGQHHARSARMGDDGEVLPFQFGQGENATHRRQLLARIATHDARLAEQRLHCRIAAGDGTRMRTCRTASALAAARLDGGNPAPLLYQRRGMEQQPVGVADAFYVKQFYL